MSDPAPDAVPTPERRFGRYRVVKELGTGAMGAVYLATDEVLGRSVAIKTIRPRGLGELAAATFRARFSNEAKAVAALSHPNIVSLFDIGCESDTPFLVMEVVSGESLKERLQHGPLSASEARMLGIQIARALDAAHARGIVHRDVKPANILYAGDGNWKLADFGVARIPDSSLTFTGQFLGSPAYAAPEALRDGALGPASDVYSLGATLYESLAGEPPFGERGLASVAVLASKEDAPQIAGLNVNVPPELAAAIMHAINREPSARPNAAALADELASGTPVAAEHAQAPRTPVRRRSVAMIVGACALVLGIIALRSSSSDRSTPTESQPMTVGPQDPRTEDQQERWRKVQEKLSDGNYGEVREELSKLVEQYPDDEPARALLDRVQREHDTGPRHEGHRHHGKHDDRPGPPERSDP